MKRSFAILMRLYPAGYRALFAEEMTIVFEDARRECRSRGWSPYLRFLLSEFAGIVSGAVKARFLGWWHVQAIRTLFSYLAGAMASLIVLRAFLQLPLSRFRLSHTANGLSLTAPEDTVKLMTLAAVSVVVIAGCSAAFVLNLRFIARRIETPSKT